MCFVDSVLESVEADSAERGIIIALSRASPPRRGRVDMSRVVERRRWLQKRQCWVRIGRRWVVILRFERVLVDWWSGLVGLGWVGQRPMARFWCREQVERRSICRFEL